MTRLLRTAFAIVVLGLCAALLQTMAAAPTASAAGAINESMEREFAALVNSERTSQGLAPLAVSLSIRDLARTWSGTMADQGRISHNPNLAAQIGAVDPRWQAIGENVGVGGSVSSLHQALMNSDGHRANILGRWTHVTVGVVVYSNRIWLTQNFLRTSTTHALVGDAPVPAPQPVESVWYLKDAPSGGSPDAVVPYGMSSYRQLACDWDGDGIETIGVYAGDTFYLRNQNASGSPNLAVRFGWAGVTPVCGDWNGDGVDTIGVYAGGHWYLRNANAAGLPESTFTYGWSAAAPVVGDWDGDGIDGIGVMSAGNWYLRSTASSGGAEAVATYGYSGALPVSGDWDGDGDDSIGIFDRGTWHLRQDTAAGRPDLTFTYGWADTKPVSGDWNGDLAVGVGVVPS